MMLSEEQQYAENLISQGFEPTTFRKKIVGNWGDPKPVRADKRRPRPYPRPEFIRNLKPKPLTVVSEVVPLRVTVLDEAKALVTGDRNQSYGSPTENFTNIADLWNVQFGHLLRDGAKFTAAHIAQAQIHVKQARLIAQPKRDNYTDIAGYAACGWEAESNAQNS